METKTELLERLEKKELKRIQNLSDSAFEKEAKEWFGEAFSPTDNMTLIKDYMTDYMRWQNDKSIEELRELVELGK